MIKPLNNYVLLKPASDPSKYKLENGQIIFIDTSFNHVQHSTVVCEVVAVPDRLTIDIDNPNRMDWETDMDLRVGDIVNIHYMGYQAAYSSETPKTLTVDGVECFMCPYSQIFVAKRRWKESEEQMFWEQNEGMDHLITKEFMYHESIVIEGKEIYNVIMLNGYVLAQPTDKKHETTLFLPKHLEQEPDKKKAVVRYVGKPNRRYLVEAYADTEFKPGDKVILDRDTDIPLEYTPTFLGKEMFYRVQNCLITLKEELV